MPLHYKARRKGWWSGLPTLIVSACLAVLGSEISPVRAQSGSQQGPALQKPEADAKKTTPSLPSTGENLSERLDRGEGVIKPPAGVDPEMHVAPKDPSAGKNMPVIPPPGSPGGNQSIQPK